MYVFMNRQSCKAFGLSNGLTIFETTILWLFTSTTGDGSCNSCLGVAHEADFPMIMAQYPN